MALSPHFTLAEAEASQTATRLGLANIAPAHLHENLRLVTESILEPVCTFYGHPLSPSSWYRAAALNEAIHGAANSFHCQGLAVDLDLPSLANLDLARWCAGNLAYNLILLEYHDPAVPTSGWVHIQTHPEASERRKRVMYVTTDGAFHEGLPA